MIEAILGLVGSKKKEPFPHRKHSDGSRGYRLVAGIDDFLEDFKLGPGNSGHSCDLGCGSNLRNPFGASSVCGIDSGVDLGDRVIHSNLVIDPIPLESESMDFVTAFDFSEHIPRVLCVGSTLRNPFIEVMDEIYRVLKPGGYFFHCTPAYPSPIAFQDPTHVNINTEDTMPLYFCGDSYKPWLKSKAPIASIYGFKGSFELIDQAWFWNYVNIISLMRKPLNAKPT